MRIRIDLKIFIFAIIFLFTHQIKIYSLLMFFALIHELGHLFTGLLLKFKPSKLEIMIYGISIEFEIKCSDYNVKIKRGNLLSIKKLVIAIAGPLTNLIIIILFWIFDINFLGIEREIVIYCNMLLGIFNLIPIYPLDGGRILKEILHINAGLEKSYKYSNLLSKIIIYFLTFITSFLILYLKNIALIIVLMYLWYLVVNEDKKYQRRKKIYNECKNLS